MRTNIFQVVKAVLAAVLFSLLFVLLFTVIIQLFSLPLNVVKPVNQVFKILSIASGGLIFIRGDKGLISWSLSFSWMFLVELFLGAVAGAICGVIAVNIKKNA